MTSAAIALRTMQLLKSDGRTKAILFTCSKEDSARVQHHIMLSCELVLLLAL